MGLLVAMVAACGSPSTGPTVVAPVALPKLAMLQTESLTFPETARAITDLLGRARVRGFSEAQISKVSLEVVQLSIECVDQTMACLQNVGRSLHANQMLFATIERGPKPESCRVTVSLFDVDAAAWKRRATKLFDTGEDASDGVHDVIDEATRP